MAGPGGLALPQEAAGTHEFVKVVRQCFHRFPKSAGLGQGGEINSKPPGYVFKSMLRQIAMWAQSRTPWSIWSSWTIGEIDAIAPDKHCLLSALPRDMPACEAQRFVGVNPFQLSAWACLFHGILPRRVSAFERAAPDTKLQRLAQHLENKNGMMSNLGNLGKEWDRNCKQL